MLFHYVLVLLFRIWHQMDVWSPNYELVFRIWEGFCLLRIGCTLLGKAESCVNHIFLADCKIALFCFLDFQLWYIKMYHHHFFLITFLFLSSNKMSFFCYMKYVILSHMAVCHMKQMIVTWNNDYYLSQT